MPEALSDSRSSLSPGKAGLWVAAGYGVLLLLAFHQTVWSMVSIWLRSETFAHGFLILPISLWLVWEKRESIFRCCPRPALIVVFLTLPLGFGWLVAWLVDVLVIQQLALVGLLLVGIWTLLGHEMARLLAFPLGFLFFAVPMGEALIPPLMEFTATSTVWMIEQTGIPVFREGLYFTLPSGKWSVVEACSGVRYLIASVTLGVLYAAMTYRSAWRRGLFVLASIIVPVFANTVRAYMIVMLGHVSDMTIATGADHLIYGWVFFGLVIMLLFWVGSFFREDGIDELSNPGVTGTTLSDQQTFPRSIWWVFLVSLLAAAMWPGMSSFIESEPVVFDDEKLVLAAVAGEWRKVEKNQRAWIPRSSVSGLSSMYYQRNGDVIGLHIQYPVEENDSEEVVGSIGAFVMPGSEWRVVSRVNKPVRLSGRNIAVKEAIITGVQKQYIALSWYRIGGRNTNNEYLAKFHEILSRLDVSSSGSYRLVLAMPAPQDLESGRRALRDFLDENLSELEHQLDGMGSPD